MQTRSQLRYSPAPDVHRRYPERFHATSVSRPLSIHIGREQVPIQIFGVAGLFGINRSCLRVNKK
ncbi:unnamed protein product [marine sediment metagenome]|uniref:Uncharacterized protein n=1 Tax=marine sediment metagenome TaxID=412755 RepID=X0U5Y8_9ZZZZ